MTLKKESTRKLRISYVYREVQSSFQRTKYIIVPIQNKFKKKNELLDENLF